MIPAAADTLITVTNASPINQTKINNIIIRCNQSTTHSAMFQDEIDRR
jgi:hypothetical protein